MDERTTDDETAFATVAAIAASRSRGWRLMAEACSPPDARWVERLREGSWQREVRESTSWLGDAAAPLLRSVAVVDAWVRGDPDDTSVIASLRTAWVDVARIHEHVPRMRALADLVDEEATAWRRGHLDRAKALRVEEAEVIDTHLVPVVPAWCASTAQSPSPFYASTARLMSSWMSVESGRDFDSSPFPGSRGPEEP